MTAEKNWNLKSDWSTENNVAVWIWSPWEGSSSPRLPYCLQKPPPDKKTVSSLIYISW
jgi:hypothetical protein